MNSWAIPMFWLIIILALALIIAVGLKGFY